MLSAADDADATERQDAESAERSARLSSRQLSPPGEVPGYKIEYCLGEGAYGSVWLAAEQNTGKRVAIKFYTHRGGLDWSLLNREVEKLAILYTSREIVHLKEVGWDAQPPYYVMEYLENGSLAALLREGSLSTAETVRIAESILRALIHAHSSGILHCDLKPANVLLDADMQPRLADFGQSRLSNEQQPALGTLFYMAPEQADMAAIPDARWDVYALGSLLYHCLCGEPPFRTKENEERILAADSLRERLAVYRGALESSERPTGHRRVSGVDKRLAGIIDRCLERDPNRRYPNAQAVLSALQNRAKQRARRPAVVMGIVAPLLLLAALVPLGFWAAEDAVNTAEEKVAVRAAESNKLAAVAIAELIESELVRRVQELQIAADDPELSRAVKTEGTQPHTQRKRIKALIEEFRQIYGVPPVLETRPADRQIDRPQEVEYLDTSWFLTDARGRQVMRAPFSEKSIDHDYYWRDYFHWRGEESPQADRAPPAWENKRFHISVAFKSQTTQRLMVAISVLVRDYQSAPLYGELARAVGMDRLLFVLDWFSGESMNLGQLIDLASQLFVRAEPERPQGVLARTIDLGKLLATSGIVSNEERVSDDGTRIDRIVAMVDGRNGKILDHQYMEQDGFKARTPDEIQQVYDSLQLSEAIQAQMAARADEKSETDEVDVFVVSDYRDPAAEISPEAFGERWMAAFARVPGTDWWTVVQERHRKAIEPVEDVRSELTKYGMIGLLFFFTLISVLWFFLLRGLKYNVLRFGALRPRRGAGSAGSSERISDSGRNSSVA